MGMKEVSRGRYTELDSNIIEFTRDNGESIFIETEVKPGVRGLSSNKDSRGLVTEKNFSDSLEKILTTIGSSATRKIQNLIDIPDEIKIEFGIKFNANAGAIITSGEDEANLKVSLKWMKSNRTM